MRLPSLTPPADQVNVDTHCECHKKKDRCERIDDIFINRNVKKLNEQKMNIGIAFVYEAQSLANLPMPICKETITEPIKDSECKP